MQSVSDYLHQFDIMYICAQLEDRQAYQCMMRMDEDTYDYILRRIKPTIKKRNTRLRDALQPDLRLTVFLRYLAFGE